MPTLRTVLLVAALMSWVVPEAEAAPRCARDAVAVGTLCVDKYEASVWRIPAGHSELVKKVKRGRVKLEDLMAAGATQLCPVPLGNNTCGSCSYGPTFPVTGNWTEPAYAVSVSGVLPSSCITWFQAEQACRLSDKRLLTNQEWQAAAAGTPDPGNADDGTTTCTTNSDGPAITGARSACVSAWGAHDMVGNVWEWVGNWADLAAGAACANWDSTFGDDITCMGPNYPGPEPTAAASQALAARRRSGTVVAREPDIYPVSPHLPGALIRGGNFATGTRNGVFAVYAGAPPHNTSRSTGFRCAR